MECKCGLVGYLSQESSLNGTLAVPANLVGYLTLPEVISDATDEYDGEYIIIPSSVEQVLQTTDKLMRDDVTVKEIPYYETANLFGGETVYIG